METNGLKAGRDDLLSISIYKPDDGEMYNRFLPLEKQSYIREEAFAVHHISEQDLRGLKPLTQDEVLSLLVDFELTKRTILTFGGKGFDKRFLLQYCHDHGLYGLDNLNYLDFKTMVHSSGNRFYPASKDNLCIAFGIENVSKVHTSENDCRLEWELFKRIDHSHLLVTDQNVFKLTPEYIVPASYLDRYSGLRTYANIPKRYVQTEKVYELALSEEQSEAVRKFPNNFSGNAIEHLINTLLHTTKIDSRHFLLENKAKLEYVGSFSGSATIVNTEQRADGTVVLAQSVYDRAIMSLKQIEGYESLIDSLEKAKALGGFNAALKDSSKAMSQYEKLLSSESLQTVAMELEKLRWQSMLTDAISEVNLLLKEPIRPLINELSRILGSDITSQELVVNEEDNCLALCDLSSANAAVEIKTGWNGAEAKKFINQLYYSSSGRDCYLLHIDWRALAQDPSRCDEHEEGEWQGSNTASNLTTKFVLEKVIFSSEAPKRKSSRKRPRTRHAVMDWRQLNPDVNDWRECVFNLKLNPNDVENVWDKCDPKSFPKNAPQKGVALRVFKQIQRWRSAHPDGTRLELSEQIDSQLPTIEKWWYLATPDKLENGEGSAQRLSEQSIKEQIKDISNESNVYPLFTCKDIAMMGEEAERMGLDCGLPFTNSWYLPYDLPYWNELVDETKVVQCAEKIKNFMKLCEERSRSGYKALTIPLEDTSYKTSEFYCPLKKSVVRFKLNKKGITIYVAWRKVITLSEPSSDLFKFAIEHIDKPVAEAFIARTLQTDSSNFYLVYKD